MAGKCFNKLKGRYEKSRSSEWSTETIIGEIFDLSDKNIKNQTQITGYMHELKSRGGDALFTYYVKYIRRVLDDDVDIKHINVHYALNQVIKMNDAEKLWKFVNLLQDLSYEKGFKLDHKKCGAAFAKIGDIKYNLYWAETYPDFNEANIEAIINSGSAKDIVKLVLYVRSLTVDELSKCVEIVKNSKDRDAKRELKQILKERNITIAL